MLATDLNSLSRRAGTSVFFKKVQSKVFRVRGGENFILCDTKHLYTNYGTFTLMVHLPKASNYAPGEAIYIKDNGSGADVNTQLNPAIDDTIDGDSSVSLNWNYAGIGLVSDGISMWLRT